MRSAVRLALALAAISACTEQQPLGPRTPSKPSFDISDAIYGHGNAHFYLLPPMVPQPTFAGITDGTLHPDVMVCEWRADVHQCATVVAAFGANYGAGSNLVRYDPAGEDYAVNWDTKTCLSGACTLDPTKTYRLHVFVNRLLLGFADVQIVDNGSQLKNIQTGEYVGLKDGRTLPVKFRIEQGAVNVASVGAPAVIGTSGGFVTSSDGAVSLSIPSGALATNTSITTANATSPPPGSGSWSPVVDLGPNGTTFASPVVVRLPVDVTKLPAGVPFSALGIYTVVNGGWVPVAGSTPDASTGTISAPISHFSVYAVLISPNTARGTPTPSTIKVGQSTTVSATTWSFETVPGQTYCQPILGYVLDPATGQWQSTYVGTDCLTSPPQVITYPAASVAVTWTSSAPTIASVAAGPTFTDANGVADSPPIIGVAPGSAQVVGTADGVSGLSAPIIVISAAPPPDGFVFVHIDANGVDDLYYMNLDGTGVRALTNDAAGDFDPAVSPDGQRIAWHSVRDGTHAIWVMNIDGSGAHRLATCGFSSMPTWSPDGTHIAYHSNCGSGNDDIWMTNADGSGTPSRLTINPAVDAMPAWSPDGGRIAFARTSNGSVSGYDLYILTLATGQEEQVSFRAGEDDFPQWSADGNSLVHNCDNQACMTDIATHTTRVVTTSADFSDHRPSWSADGKLISYIAPRLPGVASVWIMNADGSGTPKAVGDPTMNAVQAVLVTHAPAVLTARPSAAGLVFVRTLNGVNDLWYMNLDGTGLRALTSNTGAVEARVSPDGRRVAWRNVATGNELWIANIDGSNAHILANCNYSSDPSWSPDGQRIVYHSNCSGGDHLWIINADGTGRHQLTTGGVIEGMPAWSADGSQIAFGRLATSNVDDYDVWLLDLATGQQTQVTFHAGPDFYPQWSPDGNSIAHDCGPNILQACLTNVATHVTQQFTGPDGYQSRRPAIAPDGGLIAYAGFVPNSSNSGIWTIRADGTGTPTLVSNPAIFVFQPAWVPRTP